MSEVVAVPPPPPPPVPPQPSNNFDFVRPLTFIFEDPQWLSKVLLGALFTAASILLFGIFIVYGYLARLVRQVIAGVERPLPDWTDIGDYLIEGVKLFVATLLYLLPVMFLVGLTVPFSILGSSDVNEAAQTMASVFGAGIGCLIFPLSLILSIWLPAAIVRAAALNSFSAAFDFAAIWRFISANALNYILAWLVWFVARLLVGFGFFACCVGIFVTAFWSMLVGAYAFGVAWRMAPEK